MICRYRPAYFFTDIAEIGEKFDFPKYKNQNFSDTEKENLKIFWCENCRAKTVFKKKYIYFPKYSPPSIDKKF